MKETYFKLLTILLVSSNLISCGGSDTKDTPEIPDITVTTGEEDNYGYIVNLPTITATSRQSFSINWKVTDENNNCEADVLMMSKSHVAEDSLSNQTVLNGEEAGDYSINCYLSNEGSNLSNHAYKCEGILSSPTEGNIVKNYEILHDRNATYYLRVANQSHNNGIDYGDIFYTLGYSEDDVVTITKYAGGW